MKKYLLLLTVICLIASLAACNNNNTSEQTNSDVSSEQQETAEPTNTPEVTPTQEAEPTETPVVEEVQKEIEIPNRELPAEYSYDEETKILTYQYEFNGQIYDIQYPGVDKAGKDIYGNVAFYSEETNQEIWFANGWELGVIDHNGEVPILLPGFALINKPIFTEEQKELELAYYAKVERDVAAMNEALTGNYSQELKDFINNECITMINPKYMDVIFEEINYLEKLLNGASQDRTQYPSRTSDGIRLYEQNTVTGESIDVASNFLIYNGITMKYPDANTKFLSFGVTCNYLFKDSENIDLYQKSIMSLLHFGTNATLETYNQYINDSFGDEVPIEIVILNRLYQREFTLSSSFENEDGTSKEVNFNGTTIKFEDLSNDLISMLEQLAEVYKTNPPVAGTVSARDYMEQNGFEVPELAIVDEE